MGGVAALLFALLLAGCESTRLAPHAGGGNGGLEDDERRLWTRSAEEETRIDESGSRFADPALDAWLTEILFRLYPDPLPGGARLQARVIVDPTLNAFAYPNGVIYIHTGLLALMENEAQLATIFGHELSHVTHRHGIRNLRKARNVSAFSASFAVGTLGIGAPVGAIGGLASISGYSKDLERDADRSGFVRVVAAGYDPRETVRIFTLMRDHALRSRQRKPFFFGSHPRLQERIDSFNVLLAALPEEKQAGRSGVDAIEARLPPVLIANAGAALALGSFDDVLANVDRVLTLVPASPDALYLRGEVWRRRASPGDSGQAISLFRDLTAAHPGRPEPWRSLGLMFMKEGQNADAVPCFRRYLELVPPDALDRAHVFALLNQCETSS